MRGIVWIMIGMVGVSGCGPRGEQVMIQTARGADYSSGYGDGCKSGRHAAGLTEAIPHKETQKYLHLPQYKEGWDTGFAECKYREEHVQKWQTE